MKRIIPFLLIFISIFFATQASGQELHQDLQGIWHAKVLEIVDEEEKNIPGTNTNVLVQTIKAKLLDGERKGEILTLENDYHPMEEGDSFYMNYLITIDGTEILSVRDINRVPALTILVSIFVLCILLLGGFQGLRAVLGLFITFIVIIYVLLPLLLKGYPPVLTSSVIASSLLFIAIYLTHGFRKESTVAFLGTVISVFLTSIFALSSVKIANFTGFGTEESVFLNFATFGNLDLTGLLLGGIIIGVLGVLDDIAITQVAVVRELKESASHLSKKDIYSKALKVGREHAGALVNTLALAYTGASLPLMLLFSVSQLEFGMIVNQEAVALEIVRTIVGSVGLLLTIPITTLLAVFMLKSSLKT